MSFGQFLQVVVAVEAGAVAVAEIEAEGIIAHFLPSRYGNSREVLRAIATVLVTEDIAFADVLRAR